MGIDFITIHSESRKQMFEYNYLAILYELIHSRPIFCYYMHASKGEYTKYPFANGELTFATEKILFNLHTWKILTKCQKLIL